MQLSTSTRADGGDIWNAPRQKLKGRSILDEIFNRFDGSYPGAWKNKFARPESLQNWKDECVRTFIGAGITLENIAVGLRSYQRLYPEWPPTVQQFADACLPPVDPVAAYYEAIAGLEARGKGEMGEWSHPAIYWAASKLARDMMSQSYAQVSGRWAAAIKAQLARGEWDDIPPPRLALAAPGETKLSREAAAQMVAQLGAMGIMKRANGDFDHMRWAKAIMERHERGDATLTSVQVREARAALESAP